MVRMVARLIAVALFCAVATVGGSSQDILLDLARLARRSGMDLFSRWREHVGEGHGPDRQDVVPQRRRSLAAGGDPRRHRRQGRRHRHHEPDPGSLVDVVKEARAAGIPVINFNTPDAKVNFNAYVGGDLLSSARRGRNISSTTSW